MLVSGVPMKHRIVMSASAEKPLQSWVLAWFNMIFNGDVKTEFQFERRLFRYEQGSGMIVLEK